MIRPCDPDFGENRAKFAIWKHLSLLGSAELYSLWVGCLPNMHFVIPKKKRVVERPEIDTSLLEPKAIIEDVSPDSSIFTAIKKVVMEGTSDRQTHLFMHADRIQLIKNRFLEHKYGQFKANLRLVGQSDAESYEFLLIGFDPDDSKYIADNGYTVGTAFCGDLGLVSRGVYLYRYVDLVTPSIFFKDEIMRVMVFRTLRGKCYAVGLGSTELEPTLECSSHIAAPDHIPAAKKNRQQLHRQAAVYHYEYSKDMSLAEVPSGVLPYAIVDLRFGLSEKCQHNSIPPILGYVDDPLHFYTTYEGELKICSATYTNATLCTVFEDAIKPNGLDGSLEFMKLMKWPDVYDIRGVAQLMAPDVWGAIVKQREVCVKNSKEQKWKFLYVSHFVWVSREDGFATMVNAMRVEQCAAVSYSIDATTYVAFPSSQFSNFFGLPWFQIPSLHVLVINANPLFYADPSDLNSLNDETELINKTPLGTAVLDGDDVTLQRFLEASDKQNPNSSQTGQSDVHASSVVSAQESPTQISEQSYKSACDSYSLHDDVNDERSIPLPLVSLPPSAGKSCLRAKPPQVFVTHPPLIGKTVPPPAPGSVRNSNENKCRKKLSNDRDEAVKAGLHGRSTKDPPLENDQLSNSSVFGVIPDPSITGTKNKDLFQGVFSTIAKGSSMDAGAANVLQDDTPVLLANSEPSKNSSIPRRLGQTKNCIITSLPLPQMSRIADGNREAGGQAASNMIGQSSEDELTICDMEIESGSEGALSPPPAKRSPERSDEVIDFIDDHDEDYDAQFKCESSSSWESQTTCSPQPVSTSFSAEQDQTSSTHVKSVRSEHDSHSENIPASCVAVEPLEEHCSDSPELSSEHRSCTSPSPAVASEMPENVIRLLELLRANESAALSRDTDLRMRPSVTTSSATSTQSGGPRKSRFDQPPPELADQTGFVPKPVPTASKVVPPSTVPQNALPSALPQAFGLNKEKPPDSTKLFHILTGARLLQSQRDKQATECSSSSISNISAASVTLPKNSVPQPSVTVADQASSNSRLCQAVTSTVGGSIMSSSSTTQCDPYSTPAIVNRPIDKTVLGLALGLSDDAVKQLMKRSSAESRPPELLANQNPSILLDAPASPDPEGPASPDAPASPDPEESTSGTSGIFRRITHSEIPLDCWQPSKDIRSITDKLISIRTPRKPKRPKDHDGISENSATGVCPAADDEEEEGEILSDGSDDPHEAPQPITVIGASSNNFHSSFAGANKPKKSEGVHPMCYPLINAGAEHVTKMGLGRSLFTDQPLGTNELYNDFPLLSHTFATSWPPNECVQHILQGGDFQYSTTRHENPPFTVILPDFMMFNRTAMFEFATTRMDPTGFESFCERLKVVQTEENRRVSLHFHERLLQYISEMMQTLAGSDSGNAFHSYYSVILKYKNLGIVHFMERHACDDSDVSAAQTINCFMGLRKSCHPSTILIYMSSKASVFLNYIS
ncbi:unnamed protein product [Angiostrongylus costaricensis]|uniref:DUF3715 domain-containing protein n=1 Tax=Angiostrongylus costaricensis TaxID=334426 RepID=A0A158PIY0_ANGCS|nr:unnamed protein product [Angiostrongylus costaricensis]